MAQYNNNRNNNSRGGNNRNNNNNRGPRYTGRNVDPKGDAIRMGRFALGKIRDMANGKFNMNDAHLFIEDNFVAAANQAIVEKIRENDIYYMALTYTYGATTDSQTLKLINKAWTGKDGWNYALTCVNQIHMTKDLSIINGMLNRLPNYRNVLY